MVKPLISIVIPAYNIEKELMSSVNSILSQHDSDVEIVIVNDGSVDRTAEVCDRCAKKNKNVHVIHQPNGGVVSARRRGALESRGAWIWFVDGDDCLMPGSLMLLKKTITNTSADFVQFGYVQENFDKVEDVRLPVNCGILSVKDLIAKTNKTPLEYLGMCIWNKCYRKKVVLKVFDIIGDVKIAHSEDGLFAFAAFVCSERVVHLNHFLYKYQYRSNSALRQVHLKIVEDRELFVYSLKQIAEKYKLGDVFVSSLLAFHSYESMTYIWGMLIRNNANYKECQVVLRRLRASDLLLLSRVELTNWKRKLLFWLLCRPRAASSTIMLLRHLRRWS